MKVGSQCAAGSCVFRSPKASRTDFEQLLKLKNFRENYPDLLLSLVRSRLGDGELTANCQIRELSRWQSGSTAKGSQSRSAAKVKKILN